MKIEKGTESYKRAQVIANKIMEVANTDRWHNNSYFEIAFEEMGGILIKVKELDHFAAKVANTLFDSMNPYNRKVAYMSKKQAWIMACAIVENNVDIEF